MKYLDEYRDGRVAAKILGEIARVRPARGRSWKCAAGQTHSIVKHGVDRLLPENIELVHGPGCPVCVTPLEQIDKAHAIAARPGVIFTSFGDMLRVPGSHTDLLRLKSDGRRRAGRLFAARRRAHRPGEPRTERSCSSPSASRRPRPPTRWRSRGLARWGSRNFSMLVSHVLVPPAMAAVLQSPGNRVQGFLGPGHVCTVMGYREYEALAAPLSRSDRHHRLRAGGPARRRPAGRATSGERCGGCRQPVLASGEPGGQRRGPALIWSAFEVCDRKWRGIGTIPKSGLRLRYDFHAYDAERRFEVGALETHEPAECISGQILRGLKKPHDCPAFGSRCTPAHPLGATMVSAEGACAAYFAYGRHRGEPVAVP